MAVARLANGEIAEVRIDLDIQDIPPHKRSSWRVIRDDPPTPLVKHARVIRESPVIGQGGVVEWGYRVEIPDVKDLIAKEASRRFSRNLPFNPPEVGYLVLAYLSLEKKENKTPQEQELFDSIVEVQEYILQVMLTSKNLKDVEADNFDEDGHWPTPPANTVAVGRLLKFIEAS